MGSVASLPAARARSPSGSRRRESGAPYGPYRGRHARTGDCSRASSREFVDGGDQMIRFTTRAIRYLGAFLNGKLDEVMDPRVQIEQAIAEAQRQHGMLSDQAGAVIGHQRELEIKIARAGTEASRLRECAGQALLLAERSRASGDAERAANHEATARVFANQLASLDSTAKTLAELHAKALV